MHSIKITFPFDNALFFAEYNQMRKHYNLDLGTLTFTEFQQLDKNLLRVTVDGYMKEVLKAQGKI